MMRICPKCSAYYADDSLAFCLVDGTPLISVDPSNEKWSEGSLVIEQEKNALRKQKRNLKWRRILMIAATALITTMVVAKSFTVETVPSGASASPTPSPPSQSASLSPSPSRSRSPTPTPKPTPMPTPVFKITGRVMAGSKPLSGVNIVLKGARTTSTTTDANGNYIFGDLRAGGSYTITPARAKIDFTPRSRSINNLNQDGSADFNGLVQPDVYKISGRVMDAVKPLGGVNMMLKGTKTASTTTDASGNYDFSDLPAGGSYTITPASGKMTFTPNSRSINNLAQDESAHFSALVKHDQILTPACSVADEGRERRTIIDRFGAGWQRKIEGAPPKTSANGLAVGQKSTLGPIEYQFTFVKECTGAFITATYVWEVTSPVGRTRVPGEKKFGCSKVVGIWVCP